MVSFKASPVLLTWENESTVILCVLLERSKEIDKKRNSVSLEKLRKTDNTQLLSTKK